MTIQKIRKHLYKKSALALLVTLTAAQPGYCAAAVQLEQIGSNAVQQAENRHAAQTAQATVENRNAVLALSSANIAAAMPSTAQIAAWLLNGQAANASGLIASHPDDPAFIYHEGIQQEWAKIYANTQAYTYDQAVAAISLLENGNTAAAKKIFDFFYAEWQRQGAAFSGFWSVYNTDKANEWKRYEWKKEMGANCWMALFCLRYEAVSGDSGEKGKAKALATAIGKWASSLPRYDGAVAMTPDMPNSNTNWGKIYSTEFNLDFYALTKELSATASTQGDRDFFMARKNEVAGWLKFKAWDPAKGMFKRGGKVDAAGNFIWDPLWTLDVQAWALSAIGPDALKQYFPVDPDMLILKIEQHFMVKADGTFTNVYSEATGFDFADAANAQLIGRKGVKWIEGTNQVILAYLLLSDYHDRNGNSGHTHMYRQRAAHFQAKNAENALYPSAGGLTYTYASAPNVQLYAGTGNWLTFPGAAIPSATWVLFSNKTLNPFMPRQMVPPGFVKSKSNANIYFRIVKSSAWINGQDLQMLNKSTGQITVASSVKAGEHIVAIPGSIYGNADVMPDGSIIYETVLKRTEYGTGRTVYYLQINLQRQGAGQTPYLTIPVTSSYSPIQGTGITSVTLIGGNNIFRINAQYVNTRTGEKLTPDTNNADFAITLPSANSVLKVRLHSLKTGNHYDLLTKTYAEMGGGFIPGNFDVTAASTPGGPVVIYSVRLVNPSNSYDQRVEHYVQRINQAAGTLVGAPLKITKWSGMVSPLPQGITYSADGRVATIRYASTSVVTNIDLATLREIPADYLAYNANLWIQGDAIYRSGWVGAGGPANAQFDAFLKTLMIEPVFQDVKNRPDFNYSIAQGGGTFRVQKTGDSLIFEQTSGYNPCGGGSSPFRYTVSLKDGTLSGTGGDFNLFSAVPPPLNPSNASQYYYYSYIMNRLFNGLKQLNRTELTQAVNILTLIRTTFHTTNVMS